jgi:hypothetical protein
MHARNIADGQDGFITRDHNLATGGRDEYPV